MKYISIFIIFFSMASPSFGQYQSAILEKYRQMALEYNHSLKAAQKNISASMEYERMVRSDNKPKLAGGANASYVGNPAEISLGDFNVRGGNAQYGAAIALQQPIYTGGRILEAINLAQLQGVSTIHETEAIYSSVCFQTDMQYWNTVARNEMVKIAEDYYNSISSLVKTIKERVEIGLVDPQDLLMAEVKQNEAKLRLIQAQNSFETGLMALNSIVGLDINNISEIDSQIPMVHSYEGLLSLDGAKRPEILHAENGVKIAEGTLRLNDSKYKPQLYAGAEGSYSSPGYNFRSDLNPNYNVHIKLSVPIFEWGKRKKEKNFSSYKVGVATDNLNRVKDNVRLEVETAKKALLQTLTSVELSESSLAKAQENERRALERYNEGENSILEVIDAQLYRQQSQINFVQSKMSAQMYYSELLKALNMYNSSPVAEK